MIEIVTFTGVDERTDLDELRYVASKYLFAEFGILVGSQTGDGNPIFPPLPLVYRLKDILLRDRIAIHLCGGYARQAMNHPGAGAWNDGLGLQRDPRVRAHSGEPSR